MTCNEKRKSFIATTTTVEITFYSAVHGGFGVNLENFDFAAKEFETLLLMSMDLILIQRFST